MDQKQLVAAAAASSASLHKMNLGATAAQTPHHAGGGHLIMKEYNDLNDMEEDDDDDDDDEDDSEENTDDEAGGGGGGGKAKAKRATKGRPRSAKVAGEGGAAGPSGLSTPAPKSEKRIKKTKGRVRIKMEFIDNKIRRYTTFSKRKTGIMKKAYELSTLTGTQVMLLVASETGHVYTYATEKLKPIFTSETGKSLIQSCLAYEHQDDANQNSFVEEENAFESNEDDEDDNEASSDPKKGAAVDDEADSATSSKSKKRKAGPISTPEPKAKQPKAPKNAKPPAKAKGKRGAEPPPQPAVPTYPVDLRLDYESQFNSGGNGGPLGLQEPTTLFIRDQDTDQIQKLTLPAASIAASGAKSAGSAASRPLLSLPTGSATILGGFGAPPDVISLASFNSRAHKY